MKKIFPAFIVFFFVITTYAQDIKNYSQARIYYHNASDVELLLNNGVTIDEGRVKKFTYTESIFSDKEIQTAKNLGFEVEILIEDWQKHYEENIKNAVNNKNTSPCNSSQNYTVPSHFNLGSMGGFLNYTELLAELDEMQTLYPNLISLKSPISTFTTYENRPIYWVKISNNPNVDEQKPELLYTAIHHAREPASLQQLVFFMWYLLENYATDSQIHTLIDHAEIYFVPVINPDGYVYNQTTNPDGGGMWRKNRKSNGNGSFGVDNNRNYSYHWGETGTSTNPSDDTYCGPAAFSEVENQAIKWFVENRDFKIALNAHTYSNLLLYPYSWQTNQFTPDNETFVALSTEMVKENGYVNQISSDLYPAAGDSDDWMYAVTDNHDKIFAMTDEIGSDFWIPQSTIIPVCQEMVHLNMTPLKVIHHFPQFQDLSFSTVSNSNASLNYSIKNLSILDTPGQFVVSIIPISNNIVSVSNPITHSNVPKLGLVNGNIGYTLSSNIQTGETIVFKIVINNGLFDSTYQIEKTYGDYTIIFSDACASISPNWTNTNWTTTTSSYVSAPRSITDSASNYTNNANKSIYSTNAVSLNNAVKAMATFYAKWDIEANYDYVQFEISTDNGNTWQPQCGKYTNAGVADQNVTGEPLYDGVQNSWIQEEISLNDYVGSAIKFRFQLVSDGGVTADGFYIDDFVIKVIPTSTATIDEENVKNLILYPNPVSNTFTFDAPNPVYKMKIYNSNGQLLMEKMVEPKTNINIEHFAKGIYWVQLFDNQHSQTLKLVKE